MHLWQTWSSWSTYIWLMPFKSCWASRRRHQCVHFFLFLHFGTANALLTLFSGSATTVSSMAVSLDCLSLFLSKSALQVSLLKANTSHHFHSPQGQPFPYPCPLICLEFYPLLILWTLAECKMDPTVSTSKMNKSHPSMKHVLWHKDGQHLMDMEWKTICQSAVLIAHTVLEPLDPLGTHMMTR